MGGRATFTWLFKQGGATPNLHQKKCLRSPLKAAITLPELAKYTQSKQVWAPFLHKSSPWVFPKIVETPPNHPFVHRVFHYFHHPFWGTPIFGNTPFKTLSPVLFFSGRLVDLGDTNEKLHEKVQTTLQLRQGLPGHVYWAAGAAGWQQALLSNKDSLPWEPETFIFRDYNPYIGGLKPSFFMVLGSKGMGFLLRLLDLPLN